MYTEKKEAKWTKMLYVMFPCRVWANPAPPPMGKMSENSLYVFLSSSAFSPCAFGGDDFHDAIKGPSAIVSPRA